MNYKYDLYIMRVHGATLNDTNQFLLSGTLS